MMFKAFVCLFMPRGEYPHVAITCIYHNSLPNPVNVTGITQFYTL